MRGRRFGWAGIVLVAMLSGCNRASLLQRGVPVGEEAAARHAVEMVRQKNFDAIAGEMAGGIPSERGIAGEMERMAAQFPEQEPVSVKVVGAAALRNEEDGVTITATTVEYEYPDRWVEAEVDRRSDGEGTVIQAMHVEASGESMSERNRFTLAGAGMAQLAMLLWWVLSAAVSVSAFVVWLRTRVRFKWVWLLYIVLGLGKFQLNWTTGKSLFELFYLQMPPFLVGAAPYGPWIFTVSMPLGAVLFLSRLEGLRVKEGVRSVSG